MIDVFLSYATEDQDAADVVAHAIAGAGFAPWWRVSGDVPADVAEEEVGAALDHVGLVVVLHSSRSHWSYEVGVATARARILDKHLPCYLDVAQSVRAPGVHGADSIDPVDLSRMDREPTQLEHLVAKIEETLGARTPPTTDDALAALLSAAQTEADAWRAVSQSDTVADLKRFLRRRREAGPLDALARRRLIEAHALEGPMEPPTVPKLTHLAAGAAAIGAVAAIIGTSFWSGFGSDVDASETAVLTAAAALDDDRLAELERDLDLAEARELERSEDWVQAVNALTSDVDAAGARTVHLEEALMALGDRVASQTESLVAADKSLREALEALKADAEARADNDVDDETKAALASQAEAIEGLRALLDDQKSAMAAVQERIGATAGEEALLSLRADLDALSTSLQEADAAADHDQHRAAIAALTERLDAQSETLATQASSLEAAEQREQEARTALQEALQAFDDRLSVQSAALSDASAERDASAAALQAAIEALDARVGESETAIAAAESTDGATREELQTMVEALRGELSTEIDGQSEAIASLNAQKEETAAALASLAGDIAKQAVAQETAVATLSARQDEATAAVETLGGEVVRQAEALAAAENRQDAARAELETRVAALGDDVVDQNALLAASTAGLEETRAALEAALASLRDDLDTQNETFASAEERRERARSDVDRVVAALQQDVDEQAQALSAVMSEMDRRDQAAQAREASISQQLSAALAENASTVSPSQTLPKVTAIAPNADAVIAAVTETPPVLETPALAASNGVDAADQTITPLEVSPVAATALAIVAPPKVDDTDDETARRDAPADPLAETLDTAPAPKASPVRPAEPADSETADTETAETPDVRAALEEEDALVTASTDVAAPPSIAVARSVKRLLDRIGYDVGAVNGLWTEDAEEALRRFETMAGLPVTGRPTERSTDLLAVAPPGLFAGSKASIYYRENPQSRAKAERFRKAIEAGGGDILNYRRIVALCDNFTAQEKTHLGFSPGYGGQVEFLQAIFADENTAAWEKRSGRSDFLVAFCGD